MAKVNEAAILQALTAGTSRAVLENRGNSPLAELLVDLCEDVVEQLKAALKERNINTSSLGLSQSLHVSDISISGNELSVGISAAFYWKYVNYGVNGTEINHGAPEWGPPPPSELSFKDAILQWIPQRGVQLPPEFSSFDSFAYAIMTNVRKHGKEARPFFEDVVNATLIETMREPIQKIIGRAIQISIVSPFKNEI